MEVRHKKMSVKAQHIEGSAGSGRDIKVLVLKRFEKLSVMKMFNKSDDEVGDLTRKAAKGH